MSNFFREVIKKTSKAIKNADRKTAIFILAIMLSSFLFGLYGIQKASLTDEHYWIFDRAPKFWKNLILERDWNGTRRSDKPGVTLMVLSAPSFLKTTNPEKYIEKSPEKIEEINFAFRLPILVFFVLSLFVFYFLLKILFGREVALWGVAFIGLSPILIGMSRTVNPDSLLWIFCAWSILSYFIFLKKNRKTKKWIFLSGFFMGLALLTKYVSSILFVYFLGIIFLEFIFQKKTAEKHKERKVFKEVFWSFLLFFFTAISTFALFYPAVWVKWSRLFLGTLGSEAFLPVWKPFLAIILAILIDILVFKNRIFTWILNLFKKNKKLLGQLIFSFFLLIFVIALVNVYSGNRWFDFEEVLSSPKSSYLTETSLSIFISNFYPLFFGVSPFILFFIIWFSSKATLGNFDFSKNKPKFALYLLIFVLLYHASSVFSHVASIIRYQIILYPLFLILGAIGAADFFKSFNSRKKTVSFILVLFVLLANLWYSKPFYMAYSSFLLPGKYYLDLKDMGYGSYEASQYLNNLPDAEKLSVWSDKKGVCETFVGSCTSNLEFKELKKVDFDYYVISSGRFSRVNRLVQVRVDNKSPNTIRFDKLYDVKNPAWELKIAGRKSNFVKVIKADTIDIETIN